jgi:hypothetical protein
MATPKNAVALAGKNRGERIQREEQLQAGTADEFELTHMQIHSSSPH